jgi:DNA mismatch endonuclease (patch repair protein)
MPRNRYQTDEPTSRRMAAVGLRDTKPERVVRSVLTAIGLRYRLHRRDLPGRPDVVLASRRLVLFVHGCFWHRHPGCPRTTTPCRNAALWQVKFRRTLERDARATEALRAAGWKVLVVWECETTNRPELSRRLQSFLNRGA